MKLTALEASNAIVKGFQPCHGAQELGHNEQVRRSPIYLVPLIGLPLIPRSNVHRAEVAKTDFLSAFRATDSAQ